MRFRYPSNLSDFSSTSSMTTASAALARKKREKEQRERQKRRQAEARLKADAERQTRDEYPATRQERVNHAYAYAHGGRRVPAEAEAARNAQASSSPIKRGLQYIYNNFVPNFNLADDGSSPAPAPPSSGTFCTAPGGFPGLFIDPDQAVPPSSSPFNSDADMTDDTFTPSPSSGSGTSSDSASFASSTKRSSFFASSNDDFFASGSSDPPPQEEVPYASNTPLKNWASPSYTRRRMEESNTPRQREEDEKARRFEQQRYERMKNKQRERDRKQREQQLQEEENKRKAEELAREREQEQARRRRAREEEQARRRRAFEQENQNPFNDAARYEHLMGEYEETKRRRRVWVDGWFGPEQERTERLKKEREARLAEEKKRREARQAEEKKQREQAEAQEQEKRKARQEEDDRQWRERFASRPRDRTSKTRSTHNRSHPYARSAKFGRTHSGFHFNPSDAGTSPSVASSSSSTSRAQEKAKNVDPLVAHFEWYETQWNAIASLTDRSPLTFRTIPWPLLRIPRSPDEITFNVVDEFMSQCHARKHAAGLSGTSTMKQGTLTKKQLKVAVKIELKNWHPDKFATRVLARVVNDAERQVVAAAADVVQKALTKLMSEASCN